MAKTMPRRASRAAAKKKTAARATATRTRKARPTPPKPTLLQSTAAVLKGTVAGAVKTIGDKIPGTSGTPDAIALLEQDHRRFEDLLKRGGKTTERAVKERREILQMLTDGLTVHELLEEKLLYPALETKSPTREIVLEGFEEHHVADVILKELHKLPPKSERWGAKFKVLKENIEHHIKEEERAMFRTARGVLTRDELQQLGARMLQLRAKAGSKNGRRSR